MACSTGSVAPAILDAAKTFDAKLIVLGTRGLSDFAGLLLGSVAHKVIHHAECPVLVVR
jgi:nucleotide-binding universal stress UspA family protein